MRNKPHIKVCHVVASSEGATWVFEQLRELRDRHDVEVVAVVPSHEGSLVNKLRAGKIRYHVIDIARGFGPLKEFPMMARALVQLVRFFRSERFDVVQTHTLSTPLTSRVAAWLADVPVRTSMIASPYPLLASSTRSIERLTYWMESVLIPSCNKSADLFQQLQMPKESIAPVIYYSPDERNFDATTLAPLDIRGEFGWPSDTPLICKVAYFYPRLGAHPWVPKVVQNRGIKGHVDLVRAAPIVLNEFPNAKFLLVGSHLLQGERHFEEIRELVRSLHLESSVIFPGYRGDANKILREADVAVQAGIVENLGGTLEALLMKCPTVATRGGGMVDSVRDGETGVLANPSDPQDLARGILELLRDPKRARALGEAGRKLALEQFTLKRTVDDLVQLYQRLLSEKSRRGKHYHPLVTFWRALVGIPLVLYIVFRYMFLDLTVRFFLRGDITRLRDRLYYRVRYSPHRLRARLGRLRRRLS